MTSTFETENAVPLHVSFDDESSQTVNKKKKSTTLKEEGSRHKWELDVEGSTHGKEEREHKKKKDKSKKPKDTVKVESRVSPLRLEEYDMPSEVICQPEKDIGDKSNEKTSKSKAVEEGGAVNALIMLEDSKDLPRPDASKDKLREGVSREKKESGEDVRDDRIIIRAATRRDFCDFGSEYSCRGFRDGKGSNFSIANSRRQNRKDACTATMDSLPGPCRFLGQPKESCTDLRERRQGREYRTDCGHLSRRYEEVRSKRDLGRENWPNGNGKNATILIESDLITYGENSKQYDGNGRKGRTETSTDEMSQLKNDMTKLQAELDGLKDCFRAAAALAGDKNKCTITKMKEHIRCNFANCMPDFAKLREKLKNCHLMNLRLCREFRACSDRDHWKRDFECLMSELNTIKIELEKMRKDKN